MIRHGILLLGHGTPSDEGTRAFLEIVRLVEAMAGEMPVSVGFMEFASPTIAMGAAELQKRGAESIAAVPVFLSGAGHTAEDIPPAIEGLKILLPQIQIQLTPHVGGHTKVAELSALRYKEAVAGQAEIPAEETLAVLAAHGSHEPEAFLELEKFALAREKLMSGIQIVPCFSQMGMPLLRDLLPELIKPNFRRIVVQPHFLLKGRLVDAIAATTAAVAKQHPEIEWIIAEPLGNHHLLAEAVLELGK
jgi:sirohydrochlorin ferrochelatase